MASTDAVASTDTVESESPQSAPPPPVSTGETQRALEALTSIEHSAQFVASDVAQLLGGLQASLHSVRTPQQYSIAFTYFPECLLPPEPPFGSPCSNCLFAHPQLSNNSLDHMTVYRDAAEHTHESVSAAVRNGRGFIEQCQMLDERMKGVQQIEGQLGVIDIALTRLESAFERSQHPHPPHAHQAHDLAAEQPPQRSGRRVRQGGGADRPPRSSHHFS